jgi:histidinol dehydrogenase
MTPIPDEKVRTVERETRNIVDAVLLHGDTAVATFTEKYDGVRLSARQFEITRTELAAARDGTDIQLLSAMKRALQNIETFHRKSMPRAQQYRSADGVSLAERITPIERVGVYVPGGKAFYPSTVLMTVVPAKVAGCKEIVLVSPPSYNGTIHPAILAAASLAGATRVFRIGGAQAVAALAYGTKAVPAVDKIVGPGTRLTSIKRPARRRS